MPTPATKGEKRAQDRHEARDNDCDASMLVEKFLRAVKIFLLNKTHVLALFYFFAQETPNLVVEHVSGYRRYNEHRERAPAHNAGSCQRAGRERSASRPAETV